MWITEEQREEELVRFRTLIMVFLGIGILIGGFTVYGVTETKLEPERAICKTCMTEETEWLYCTYDTGGVTEVSTPDHCKVEDEYIQLDMTDAGQLRGMMSRMAYLEVEVDNLTAEQLKRGCTLHLYGETVRCNE